MSQISDEKLEKENLDGNKKKYKELTRLLERIFNFKRWGFRQSYSFISPKYLPYVIYDSECCRIKFSLGTGDIPGAYEMSISYGRLHAPDSEAVIIWKGEKCHCWHNVFHALDFLDGLSPQEAVDRLRIQKQWPKPVEEFSQSEFWKKLLVDRLPERSARLHAAIWEYYGQRLFDLFDLRRPELWEEYSLFISGYYKILNRKPMPGNPFPSEDKIC